MRRFVAIFIVLILLFSTSALALKPKEGSLTASIPVDGMTYVSAELYSVAPNSLVTLENVNNGAVKNVIADNYGRFTAAIPAQSGDEIQVTYEGGDPVVDNFPDFGFGEGIWIGYSAGRAYAKAMTEPLVSEDGEVNFEKVIGPFVSSLFTGITLMIPASQQKDQGREFFVSPDDVNLQAKDLECECTGNGRIDVSCEKWNLAALGEDEFVNMPYNVKYFFADGYDGDRIVNIRNNQVLMAQCSINVKNCPSVDLPCKDEKCQKACVEEVKSKLKECGNSFKKYCTSGLKLGEPDVESATGKCVDKCEKLKPKAERGEIGTRTSTELKVPPRPGDKKTTPQICSCTYLKTRPLSCDGTINKDIIPSKYKGTTISYPMGNTPGGTIEIIDRPESVPDAFREGFLNQPWVICKQYAGYSEPGCDLPKCEEYFKKQIVSLTSEKEFNEQCQKEAELVCKGEIRDIKVIEFLYDKMLTEFPNAATWFPHKKEAFECKCLTPGK